MKRDYYSFSVECKTDIKACYRKDKKNTKNCYNNEKEIFSATLHLEEGNFIFLNSKIYVNYFLSNVLNSSNTNDLILKGKFSLLLIIITPFKNILDCKIRNGAWFLI